MRGSRVFSNPVTYAVSKCQILIRNSLIFGQCILGGEQEGRGGGVGGGKSLIKEERRHK